jgi:hypothetical protein
MADAKTTLANWRTAPHHRRAFHRVRELSEIRKSPVLA